MNQETQRRSLRDYLLALRWSVCIGIPIAFGLLLVEIPLIQKVVPFLGGWLVVFLMVLYSCPWKKEFQD